MALETWLKVARIAHGPLFWRVIGQGKAVGADRLKDQEIARLVTRTALAAGVRGIWASFPLRTAVARSGP